MIIALNNEWFEVLYEGYVVGSAIRTENRNFEVLKNLEAPITKKFHDISIPATCGRKFPTGDLARQLILSTSQIDFTEDEIKLILDYFVAPYWSTAKADIVIEIWSELTRKL